MSPSLPQSVAPVVREWIERLVWLEASLSENPHQLEVWRLQIQIKVLKFLVRRYVDRREVHGPRLVELFQRSSGSNSPAASSLCPDRTQADLLPILRRISEANHN